MYRLIILSIVALAFTSWADKPAGDYVFSNTVPEGYFQVSFDHIAMSTNFQLVIWGKSGTDSESALGGVATEVFNEIDDLESRLSEWERGSQIFLVNERAAQEPISVAADIFGMLEAAKRVNQDTGGTFDMTVGPLVELWRNSLKEKRVPTSQQIQDAKKLCGFEKVHLDKDNHSVRFDVPGMRLTTGGIGKGLAIDKVKPILEYYGVSRAVLSGGGSSILAIGTPPGEPGWKVLVQNPYNKAKNIVEVTLRDETMSLSGHVDDITVIEGKKYGHILNPKTGMPVQGMLIAMAIGPSGTDTDALTKGFFIMSDAETAAYCVKHPEIRVIVIPEPASGDPVPKRFNFEKKD